MEDRWQVIDFYVIRLVRVTKMDLSVIHLAVNIIDRVLTKIYMNKSCLRLLALTAVCIAGKKVGLLHELVLNIE